MSKLTVEQRIELIQKYETGNYLQKDLAKEFSVSRQSVSHLICTKDDIKKHKEFTQVQILQIIEKYQTGLYTCKEIGIIYGIRLNRVSKILKNHGISPKGNHIYAKNEQYFDNIDNENKAYYLGLLYADGCNNQKHSKVHISLESGDKDILLRFIQDLSSDVIIRNQKSNNVNYKDMSCLTIGSKYMCNQLVKLGCVPCKSMTLKFPTEDQVPKYLLKHFIRGMWDGDGCITSFCSQYKTKSIIINASLVGTNHICQGVKKSISEIANCSIVTQNKGNDITKRLSIGGNIQVLRFLDWLYSDATVYLQRKYDKYQECKSHLLYNKSVRRVNKKFIKRKVTL